MGLGLGVLVALAAVAWPASAGARTTISPDSDQSFPYQRWVKKADAPTPAANVVVRLSETSQTSPAGGWIELRPSVTAHATRRSFYHELGHNFDHHELDGWAQDHFAEMIGHESWGTPSEEGDHSTAEWFAETWAACADRRRPAWAQRRTFTPLAVLSTREELWRACRLIRASYNYESGK